MENNYKDFNDVSLMVTRGFFTENILKYLVKYNILTLGDLFVKADNGELYALVMKKSGKPNVAREELWSVINGTINILKCKYLNTNPQLSEKSTRVEYFNKIGISAFDGLKFKTAKLEYVSQLLEMVKNDDFSPIRSMRFKKDKYETIINKIKVLYNYFYNREIENISENNDESWQNVKITLDELKTLYDELKELIDESSYLDMKIKSVELKIEEKKSKIKTLMK